MLVLLRFSPGLKNPPILFESLRSLILAESMREGCLTTCTCLYPAICLMLSLLFRLDALEIEVSPILDEEKMDCCLPDYLIRVGGCWIGAGWG